VRAGGLGELVWLLPHLAGLIARLVQDGRVPPRAKATLGLATLYLASPIDLVPGYLDDALVVAIILDGLLNQVDREILREHWPGDPASLERAGRVAARLAVWVPRRLKARLFGGPAA
jgi:uncharacterized membrane protein YkvA (DUF1232 family)